MSYELGLYTDADIAWLESCAMPDRWAQVEAIQAEIDPTDIDPGYWGIATENWSELPFDSQKATAAVLIERDRYAMRRAGIDPDVWVQMPLDERNTYTQSR